MFLECYIRYATNATIESGLGGGWTGVSNGGVEVASIGNIRECMCVLLSKLKGSGLWGNWDS